MRLDVWPRAIQNDSRMAANAEICESCRFIGWRSRDGRPYCTRFTGEPCCNRLNNTVMTGECPEELLQKPLFDALAV